MNSTFFKSQRGIFNLDHIFNGLDSHESIFSEDANAVEEFMFFLQRAGKIQLLAAIETNQSEIVNYLKIFSFRCANTEMGGYMANVLLDPAEVNIFLLEVGDYLSDIQN